MKYYLSLLYLLLTSLFGGLTASAHELSSSYLSLNLEEQQISGYWLAQPEDLHLAITLDQNNDGDVLWQEITSRSEQIERYFQTHIEVMANESRCDIEPENLMLENRSSKIYLYLPFSGTCTSQEDISIHYRAFFENDQSHRGILQLTAGEISASTVFNPQRTDYNQSSTNSIWQNFYIFIIEGIWHIWIGLDHILFLIALLFSGYNLSNQRTNKQTNIPWSTTLKNRSLDILKTVTAFTVAHSITLILGTLGLVTLPGIVVESIIALSVAISGANVIFHFLDRIRWWFIFGFGLIHGLGFASVLGDLLTSQGVAFSSILGFNVGVEIGQLCIVAVALPLIVALERKPILMTFTTWLVGTGVGVIGLYWAVTRAFF